MSIESSNAYDKLSDESKSFHYAVYSIVKKVPYCKVTNYGHIAYLINKPQNSRQVGTALKHYNILSSKFPEFGNLPWWRIVLSSGKISKRLNSNYELLQANLLKKEGVEVLGNNIINMNEFGWFPDEIEF